MIVERVRKNAEPDMTFEQLDQGAFFTFPDVGPDNIFQKMGIGSYKNIQSAISYGIISHKVILPVKIEKITYSLI